MSILMLQVLKGRCNKMDFIKMLREDHDLADLLYVVCDVEILSEFKAPQDEFGHITYNISGKTFAKEGTGSEYILLEDGSVGYWGNEGASGRIADNLEEFFELVINFPYWKDYIYEGAYQDRELLSEYVKELFEEYEEEDQQEWYDLLEIQKKLADSLGLKAEIDIPSILMRFYHCAEREPRLILTYTEEDGSTHSGTGSLFDR